MNTEHGTLFDLPSPRGCDHSVLLTLTPGMVHYGKETCPKCGKFLRWVPKPADALKIRKP